MTESTPTEHRQNPAPKPTQKLPKPAIKKSPMERRNETERMYDVLMLLDQLFRREEAALKLILGCLYDVGSVNLVNQKINHQTANRLVKWIASLSKPIFGMIALRWFYKNCPQLLVDWLYSKLTFEKVAGKSKSPTPAAIASEVVASELGTSELTAADIAPPDSATPSTAPPHSAPPNPTLSPLNAELNSTKVAVANRVAAGAEPPQALHPTVVMSPMAMGEALVNAPEPSALASTPNSRMISLAELESTNRELVRLQSRVRTLTAILLGVTLTLGGGIIWLVSDPRGDSRQISSPLGAIRLNEVGDRT